MTDYELLYSVRSRLERVWKDAERATRLLAASGHYAVDDEAAASRETGGRV
jgi:hypothetical protein